MQYHVLFAGDAEEEIVDDPHRHCQCSRRGTEPLSTTTWLVESHLRRSHQRLLDVIEDGSERWQRFDYFNLHLGGVPVGVGCTDRQGRRPLPPLNRRLGHTARSGGRNLEYPPSGG